MQIREFVKSSFRIALAMFLACVGLIVVVTAYYLAIEAIAKRQAAPFESVREWKSDRKSSLGLEVHVKTKMVSGKLLGSIKVSGYPGYLSHPKNADGQLFFQFLDQDGFTLTTKRMKISEFTTVVDDKDTNAGMSAQFEDDFSLDIYKRFSRMQLGWNLDITAFAKDLPATTTSIVNLDHCAPGLSKAERLKRLAQFGTVRETGMNEFKAAEHRLTFLPDGILIGCN